MRFITPTLSICALAAAFTAGALTAQPSRPATTTTADTAAPAHQQHEAAAEPAPAEAGDAGGTTEASTETPVITISGFAFETPAVAAGQTVEVVNLDSAPHTVTANDGSFTVFVDAGATSSFVVPAAAGSYAFFCEIHPSMTGTLVVT